MSKYCGKYDLYDHFFMSGEPVGEQLLKSNIYYGKNNERLKIETERELALYFPYIPGSIACSHGENQSIWIGGVDYIRRREKEIIDLYVRDAKRERNLCRRKKKEYIPEEVYEKRFGWCRDRDKEQIMEIIRRVGEGGRQKFDDIRLPSRDHDRNEWYEDLVEKYDYDPEFARKWVWHLDERP